MREIIIVSCIFRDTGLDFSLEEQITSANDIRNPSVMQQSNLTRLSYWENNTSELGHFAIKLIGW